jgi:two-component system, chemotaxis family, protein-glutamate methylesterase/glutaminase
VKLRVVVVDDSPIVRALVREWLEVDRDFEVVGEAADGEAAIELITRLRPDVATIDIRMPGMSGLELVSYLMAKAPLPILVLTGEVRDDASLAFEAVRRGALDLLPKPSARDEDAIRALRTQLRRLASVPVVRHIDTRRQVEPRANPLPRVVRATGDPVIVGIAASAGGPSALVAVLAALSAELPAALAIVQHLPKGFASSFVSFLQARCALPVRLAEAGMAPRPGTVVVAPDAHHLEVIDGKFALTSGPPVEGHRPSGTVLLRSLASLGGSAIGVVLSGIGRDGAEGLRALRDRGGLTFAQDAASSVVYGMPRAAFEDGGAQEVLPAAELGEAITSAVVGARKKRWP